MTRGAYALILLVMGFGWGLTQPLGKIATSTGYQPFGLIFWQLAVCVLVLGGVTLLRGGRLRLHGRALRFYVAVAVLGTLVPNYTFYLSIERLPAGIMSVITASIPMLAFPIGLALGMERYSALRLIGLGLGLIGVALIAAPGAALPDPAMAAFLPVAMIGPLFYALEGTYVARTGVAGLDPVEAMLGASLVGLVLCLPLALGSGQWFTPPLVPGRAEWALIASSALHAVIYAGYVWLAARAGAVFAGQVSYVVTVAGVFWAAMLLGERPGTGIWLAALLVLGGMFLVRPREKQAAPV
jgi:drug/metabolite transporter (DMT)-like permease